MTDDKVFRAAEMKHLRQSLEKFYTVRVNQFKEFQSKPIESKTRRENLDRRYRLEISAIETVLKMVGSDFMANVKTKDFRKTTKLNAKATGLLGDTPVNEAD